MPEQLIDLTKIRPKDPAPWTFDQRDLILLLTTGGAGYLVKEALKHCFPGSPSVTEQLEVLANLVETCGRAGAKSGNYALDVPPKSRYINSNSEACDDRQSHRSDLQQRGSR